MIAQILDRVAETTATTGTGTVTLAGALTGGYRSFTSAYAANATVFYCIEDGTNWEVGTGLFTNVGTTLTRSNVLASSNANALVNFPGSATTRVFNTLSAQALIALGIGNVRAVVGTTDTILASDNGKLVTYTNASAVAVTLPQASATAGAGFDGSFKVFLLNLGAGTVTVTPTTSTINGGATQAMVSNLGLAVFSDGTNYKSIICGAAGTTFAHLSESFVTSSPFSTSAALEALTATDTTATNICLNFAAKGNNGTYVFGPKPDGTTLGGAARTGVVSIDMTIGAISTRSAASRVNQGNYGFTAGGYDHYIANNNSNSDAIVGGFTCTISGSGPSGIFAGNGCTIGSSGFSSSGVIIGSTSASMGNNCGATGIFQSSGSSVSAGSSQVIVGGYTHTMSGAGNYSGIFAGRNHTFSTTGSYNTLVGGFTNTMSSVGGTANSIIGGASNVVSSTGSGNTVLGGSSVTVSGAGSYSVAFGGTQSVTSDYCLLGGANSTADAQGAFVLGNQISSKGGTNVRVQGWGQRAALGDAQAREQVLRLTTADATVTAITVAGAAASAANQLKLTSNSVMKVRGQVTCVKRSTMDVAGFDFSAVLKNVAGTVTVVGTPTVTQQAADSALSATNISITADNTNKCVSVNAIGIAATALDWVANIRSVEAA